MTQIVYFAPSLIPVIIGNGVYGSTGSLYPFNCTTTMPVLVLPTFNASGGGANMTLALPTGLNTQLSYAYPTDVVQAIFTERKCVINGTLANYDQYYYHGIGWKVDLFYLFCVIAGLKFCQCILFLVPGKKKEDQGPGDVPTMYHMMTEWLGINFIEAAICLGAYAVLYTVIVVEEGVSLDSNIGFLVAGFLFPQLQAYYMRITVHSWTDSMMGPKFVMEGGKAVEFGKVNMYKLDSLMLSQLALFSAVYVIAWLGAVCGLIAVTSDFAGIYYQNLDSWSVFTDSPSLLVTCWGLATSIVQITIQAYYHIHILICCFDRVLQAGGKSELVKFQPDMWTQKWLHQLVVYNSLMLYALLVVAFSVTLAATNKVATVNAVF